MNINSNFDLRKAKNFLLTENFQMDEMEVLDEMASFYKIKPGMEDEAKEAIAAVKAKYRPGTAFYQTLDTLEKEGEVDYKKLAKETGKDIATWNKPETRNVLEKDGPLAQFLDAGSSPLAIRTGRPKTKEDEKLDENEMLGEMATFYKIKPGMEDEAKEAIKALKAKYKQGTNFYNTLDSLEKDGEVDYQKLAKSQGKDVATWNNPTTRGVLEKDGPLAQYLDAGSSPSAMRTGRPKTKEDEKEKKTPKSEPEKIKIKSTPKAEPKAEPKSEPKEKDIAQEIKDVKAKMAANAQKMKAAKGSEYDKLMAANKTLTAKLKDLNKEAGM